MALPNPAAGDSVAAAHIDSIRTHLEGGSGDTAPYKLRQSTGDFIVVLADNAGASELSIHDSDDVEVAHIDSNGNLTATTVTFTNLDIPTSASPSQTTEGRAVWDSDDDRLTIGDGSSRKLFSNDAKHGSLWVGGDTTERTTTSTSAVTLSTISSLNIPVTSGIFIRGNVRKTAGAANVTQLGLTLNSTIVVTPATNTSAANQAEEGTFEFHVPPRVTGYLRSSRIMARAATAGGAAWLTNLDGKGSTNDLPTVAITSIAITGLSGDPAITFAIDEVHVYEIRNNA